MNLVVLMGRLTADPEIRYTHDGKPIAKFSVAVNRYANGKQEADFFNCTAFGKTAENVERLHVGKGTKIVISGSIRNDNYQAKDGTTRYAVTIIVNSFEFCEKKAEAKPQAASPADEFMDIPDNIEEELPFA